MNPMSYTPSRKMVRAAAMGMFFLSGFCSLVYQVVWLRLAFSHFGIITPVLSVVLSTFMLGLGVGSWVAGNFIEKWQARTGRSPIWLYALSELGIGLGAWAVPHILSLGGRGLLQAGDMGSVLFLTLSAFMLCVALLPWCILMGATFPLMMAFFKAQQDPDTRSFSLLYTANVFGALCGTLATAGVLIETYGFRGTSLRAAALNNLIALSAALLGWAAAKKEKTRESLPSSPKPERASRAVQGTYAIYALLFITGFTGMALEVVWVRAFTMILKTTIYAFALILSVYLFGTWLGSVASRKIRIPKAGIFWGLAVCSFLPVLVNDPRLPAHPLRTVLSIFPFCILLGYLTPLLVDELSQGSPRRAGRAYTLNTIGCILGPLIASYILLPYMGVRAAMILLTLPFAVFLLLELKNLSNGIAIAAAASVAVLLGCSLRVSLSYEEGFRLVYAEPVYRRDHTATVVSCGTGMRKNLFVNGIPMTNQTSATKMMAHLPLGFLEKPPASALVICFGMGTTFRSLMSWGIQATAVELVPSVKAAFPYYFEDAERLLNDPRGRILIDDGRRYLKRTRETFDVITIDPPPPIEAAGSSLLYSVEFYDLAKQRLSEGGILQQWIPGAEEQTFRAVVSSLVRSFPYIKVFKSSGGFGYHFLASSRPIRTPTAEEWTRRLPSAARLDLAEWTKEDALTITRGALAGEHPFQDFLPADSSVQILDDRPLNEYFLLHQWRAKREGTFRVLQ
jgi:spermidine synthase